MNVTVDFCLQLEYFQIDILFLIKNERDCCYFKHIFFAFV